MARFRHTLFVCTNERPADSPKGCCASKGGKELLDRLKALTAQHNLKGKVRVVGAGCLDYCAKGCAVVAFSEAQPSSETWYTNVTPDDADALFDTHILQNTHFEPRLEPSAVRRVEPPKNP